MYIKNILVRQIDFKSVGATLIVLLFISNTVQSQWRYPSGHFSSRSEAIGQYGMVATSQPLATQVGIEILKRGGTAMDAAIAANCLLGLVEPTGNGMGGDLFAIVWEEKTKKLYGLNGSGRSPKSMQLKDLTSKGLTKIPYSGALSVSVPGCVDGWYTLHKRFGSLPINDLFKPTIDYATNGFPVSEIIADGWKGYARSLQKYDNYKKTYMPNGQTPRKGEIFRNPDLAHSLQLLVKGGRDAFYKGPIAEAIAATVKRDSGYLSREDLAAHHSDWVEPVSSNYRGYDVWELAPNVQGIAVLQMLNILEQYDLKKMGFGSAEYMHLFIEAKKLTYEDRAVYYADPEFSTIPVKGLISKEYAIERAKLIDPMRASSDLKAGDPDPFGNTIYLTVADRYGNMVSLIQSNYAGMGSGIVPDGCGFSLQNRGCSFNLAEGKPNTYAPGKRPFHTLIPAFVTRNGKPLISFGVMGADMQPLGQVQVLVNILDFGMNMQEAGDAARINHSGSSTPTGEIMKGKGTVSLEPGFTDNAIGGLLKRGHVINYNFGGYGGYQAIMKDSTNGVYYGATEFRKDGAAAGY